MASGTTDSRGIWQYGEDDIRSTASALLNIGQGKTSDALAIIQGGAARGTMAGFVAADFTALDALATTATGDLAINSTTFTGIVRHHWSRINGTPLWNPVGMIFSDTKAHLDSYIAAVAASSKFRFAVGGLAYVSGTKITYRFTTAAGAYVVHGPAARFKGTETTGSTWAANGYLGKTSPGPTFDTTDDPDGAYAAATGLYTCPVDGGYLLIGSYKTTGTTSIASIKFYKNGTVIAQSANGPGTSNGGVSFTHFVRCVAGDTLGMQVTATVVCQSDTPADNNFFEIVQVQP